MSKTKAIIFDLDGVIIDSENLWTDADLLFLKSEGINIDREIYEKTIKVLLMGLVFEDGIKIFQKHLKLRGKFQDLIEKRRSHVEKHLKQATHIKGFLEFHSKIKKSYHIAIATSLIRYFLNPIALKFKLVESFNGHVYSVEDIGFISKPKPDIYLHAAKKLGLKPTECVGIEDSPKGVGAVNSAGMKSIAITTTTNRDRLSHAYLVVDSFSEINLDSL